MAQLYRGGAASAVNAREDLSHQGEMRGIEPRVAIEDADVHHRAAAHDETAARHTSRQVVKQNAVRIVGR
ncbi:MAG: hypothetical protein H7138_22595 [Myxococcales bacterium]|nr:hypothetical protein [Myxococcales bacterium]